MTYEMCLQMQLLLNRMKTNILVLMKYGILIKSFSDIYGFRVQDYRHQKCLFTFEKVFMQRSTQILDIHRFLCAKTCMFNPGSLHTLYVASTWAEKVRKIETQALFQYACLSRIHLFQSVMLCRSQIRSQMASAKAEIAAGNGCCSSGEAPERTGNSLSSGGLVPWTQLNKRPC